MMPRRRMKRNEGVDSKYRQEREKHLAEGEKRERRTRKGEKKGGAFHVIYCSLSLEARRKSSGLNKGP